MLALPEDEASWDEFFVMFATSSGTVRRNRLSDFANIRANGLIAMKLDDGERLINVQICTDEQDVLLATRQGKCIRFRVPDVRVFAGRTSTGVRGIRLADGDEIISMSILHSVDASPEERAAYLKLSRLKRAADEAAVIEGTAVEIPAVEMADEDDEAAPGRSRRNGPPNWRRPRNSCWRSASAGWQADLGL